MANLSSSTGYTPLQTRIPLVNNATTNVQDFALYDSQQLTGLVFIDATVDKRAAIVVTVVRNGAGTYEVGATDIIGDDNSGLPIVSFSMSGSVLRATLVSYAGFVSAYIQFHLAAPLFGANYPLTVSTTNVVGRTDGAAVGAGYIGEVIRASSTTGTNVPTSGQYGEGSSITLTAGIWRIDAAYFINRNGATLVAGVTMAHGVSITIGNFSTGLVRAVNEVLQPLGGSLTVNSISVMPISFTVRCDGTTITRIDDNTAFGAGTTLYHKIYMDGYSVAVPLYNDKLTATRIA